MYEWLMMIEDLIDLELIREARAESDERIPLDQVMAELGL